MGGLWGRIREAFSIAIQRTEGRADREGASRPGRTGPAAPARSTAGGPAYDIHKLVTALEHPNPDVRAGAAHELGAFGRDPNSAGTVVSALTSALSDTDASVRSSAALSLGQCGAAAADAIPALIAALAEADDDVRSSAGIALEDIGEAARIPLEQALNDPDPRVQAEAKAILALMGEG